MKMENSSLPLNSAQPWPFDYQQPPRFTPFFFENVDTYWWKSQMIRYSNASWGASFLYLAVIFGLREYMKDRQPVKAKGLLVAWNSGLAAFSAFGFVRIAQELMVNLLQPDGYYRSLCVREGRNLPADFWGMLFVLSKYIELGDTVFVVLRKQPLIMLQWYHHFIVTVFAWKLYPWGEPILSHYSAINYGVHMVMYSYFAARGAGFKVPETLAMSITTLQIAQMVINTLNNLYTVLMIYKGVPCNRHPTSIIWSLSVYISLWVLFAMFFLNRYFLKQRKQKKAD